MNIIGRTMVLLLFGTVTAASSRTSQQASRTSGLLRRFFWSYQSSSSSSSSNTTTIMSKRFFSTDRSEGGSDADSFFTVGITGAGGLVGTALRSEILKTEREFTILGKPLRIVRMERVDDDADVTVPKDFLASSSSTSSSNPVQTTTETSIRWNPHAQQPEQIIDPRAMAAMDAIVHLGGENVSTSMNMGPLNFLGLRAWTAAKKREILDSRVKTTKALATALESCNSSSNNNKTKPKTFLVASGVGIYGNEFFGGDDSSSATPEVDETADTESTRGFLAQVSRAWEAAAHSVTKSTRVTNLRFGVVLSSNGGMLAKLHPIFWLGLGGTVGMSGSQYLSFISDRDAARAILHVLKANNNDDGNVEFLQGPVNVCTSEPCTNREFTKAMGSCLSRPTVLPLPDFAVKLMFGEMGDEMLLGGVRAVPGKLLQSGFQFEHTSIQDALGHALRK